MGDTATASNSSGSSSNGVLAQGSADAGGDAVLPGGSAAETPSSPSSSAPTSRAAAAPVKPTPKPPEFRFRKKLKVNGVEEELDLSEEEVVRAVQISRAQEHAFRTLKEERAKLDAAKKARATDPVAAIRELGMDPDEFARSRLTELARLEMMSPEERRAHEAERRAKEAEEKSARFETDAKARSDKEAEDRLWNEMEPKFHAELKAHDIPPEPWAMRLLGEVGEEFADAQLDMDPRAMVAEVSRRMDVIFSRRLAKLSVEQLEKRLGPERLKQLNARRVEAAKKQGFETMQGTAKADDEPAPPKKQQYIDEDEYRAALRKRG